MSGEFTARPPEFVEQDAAVVEPSPAAVLTAAELAAVLRVALPRATELLASATQRVEDYAPFAPAALKRESTIRFAGYIAEAGFGAISKRGAGPLEAEYVTNHGNAWRNSGAAGLLARYRVRRAGAIG